MIEQLEHLAFSDIRALVEWDDDRIRYTDSADLPAHVAHAIKSVKRTRRTTGNTTIETMDIQLHDKLGALKTLAEYHGLTDSGTMNENIRRMLNLLEAIGPDGLRALAGPLPNALTAGPVFGRRAGL